VGDFGKPERFDKKRRQRAALYIKRTPAASATQKLK